MAKTIPEQELKAIEHAVRQYPEGASLDQIDRALASAVPRRTLQHRLKHLVSKNRFSKTGERRWARYRIKSPTEEQIIGGEARVDAQGDLFIPVSKRGAEIQAHVRKPLGARKPVGYDRNFLDAYRPNATAYLSVGNWSL